MIIESQIQTPELKIGRLRAALAEARARVDELEIRYEADCQSCVHDQDHSNKRQCYLCSVKAKLRYIPVGIDILDNMEA